jgi:hypothetical protein
VRYLSPTSYTSMSVRRLDNLWWVGVAFRGYSITPVAYTFLQDWAVALAATAAIIAVVVARSINRTANLRQPT